MRRTNSGFLALLLAGAVAVPAGASGPTNEDPAPRVPPGFAVVPYAAVGGTATSLAFGKDTRTGQTGSRLYVTDSTGGTVVAFPDTNGVAGPPQTFATGFTQPLGVVAAPDGTVFVADSEATRAGPFGTRTYGRVWRLRDLNGDGIAEQKQLVLKDLPNGRHNTNGMAFGPDGKLYVANGNSTDDGVLGGAPEVVPWSGAVVRVDPNATNVSLSSLSQEEALIAHGMRNIFDVDFSPVDPTRVAIPMNGADDAGAAATPALEDSDDLLYVTDVDDLRQKRDPVTGQLLFDEDGVPIMEPVIDDFGFPSCLYNVAKKGNLDPYDNPNSSVISSFGACPKATVPRPAGTFGLHVSADGMAYQRTNAWGDAYRNDLFVAEFGNFFGDDVVGHRVVRVEMDAAGTKAVRTSDFLTSPTALDVTFDAAGNMYVADFGGLVSKVMKAADVPNVIEVQTAAFQFVPAALVIPEGTTIRWRNQDPVGLPHNVTSLAAVRSDGTQDTGSEINSGRDLGIGESHTYRFDTPGSWQYTCTFNQVHTAAMHGSITVVPAGS